jgi:hypothetical protein
MTKITNCLSRILPRWVSFKLGQMPIERKTANAFFDNMAKKSSNPPMIQAKSLCIQIGSNNWRIIPGNP